MQVVDLNAGTAEVMPDAFQQGRFADSVGAGDQSQGAGGSQVLQTRQALRQPLVGPEPFGGQVLGSARASNGSGSSSS